MGKHYFFLVFVTIFLFNSLTSAFTPRGGDLKNGQSDMKPVTFNQPWTTEEQVCLVLPLYARTEKIGESLCVVLNVDLLMKLADFPKDSWYVGVWFLWLKYSTYHFPVAFEASMCCQLVS